MDALKQKLIQKTKILFTLSVIVLVALAGLYGFVFRQIKILNINNAQIAQRTEIDFEQFFEISGQRRAINTTTAEREKLDNYFISQETVADFFKELEELAEVAGAKFAISSAHVDYDIDQLELQLTAGGSFEEVYRFLLLLETVSVGINIERIDIRRIDIAEAPPWQGTFNVTVISYQTAL